MEFLPFAGRLDLSENLVLLMHSRGMVIADRRPPRECADAPHWVWTLGEDDTAVAVYLTVEARVEGPDGTWLPPAAVTPSVPHEAYGNKVMQARADYGDGMAEDWTLRVDTLQVSFDWIRQPHALGHRLALQARTPSAAHALQFWRTFEGEQTPPCWHGTWQSEGPWHRSASGVLLFSESSRASLLLDTVSARALRVDMAPGADDQVMPSWVLDWTLSQGQLVHLSGNLGLRAAARSYFARRGLGIADASIDFDAYYDAVAMGGVALLDDGDEGLRAACLGADGGETPLEEVALACECTGLCAPDLTAALLRQRIAACCRGGSAIGDGNDLNLPPECTPGLALLMAGRYLRISGDLDFIVEHEDQLRACAGSALALRRAGEALPTFNVRGASIKQPAGTAIICAGLSRWSAIETRLGHTAAGQRIAEAALAMQWAAVSPMEAGGLWHLGRGTFVHYLPCEAQASANDAAPPPPTEGSEFDFGQQMLAFWLGLCPDDDLLRRAFEWLDYTYTYATGRGGPTYPPGYRRSFHALLGIALRLRHACGDAVPIFQRTLDLGARAGLPFSRDIRGNALPAGTLLDNAPYFEIVLQRHYGLDYDAGGWRLSNPRPIGNYPLTRVTNLRHRNAVYAVTWQGRGVIQRVTLNGAAHPSRVLDKLSGEHEVMVTLA